MEEKIAAGAFGGLVGGVCSGLILQNHWLLSPASLFAGQFGAQSSWTNHLAISLVFGMFFGALVGLFTGSLKTRLAIGVVTGILLWVASQYLELEPWTPGFWGIFGYAILGGITGLGFHLMMRQRISL